MRTRKITLAVLLTAFLAGLVFGRTLDATNFDATNLSVAEAGTQNLASVRAARGAMDMIRYDMERAGYLPFLLAEQAAVRVTYRDTLELLKADAREMIFRSLDGRSTIVYWYEGGQLTRIVTGTSSERLVLMSNVSNLKVN